MNEPREIARSDDWIVIDKPAGWHTARPGRKRREEIAAARARGGEGGALEEAERDVESWLRATDATLEALPEAGLVQRLDLETSGCLLVARHADAHARLRAEVRDGSIEKTYRALVARPPDGGAGFRLFFISRYKRSRKMTVRTEGELSEVGRCRWREVDYRPDGSIDLEVDLVGAGRRHQIRAGLAFLGAPLLGDDVYGGIDGPRLMLHAWRLRVDGVDVESPCPW